MACPTVTTHPSQSNQLPQPPTQSGRISFAPQASPSLAKHTQRSSSDGPTWTVRQEERLIYVQAQIHAANKRWSEDQALWYKEADELLELKRSCKKHRKREARDAKKKVAGGQGDTNLSGRSQRSNLSHAVRDDYAIGANSGEPCEEAPQESQAPTPSSPRASCASCRIL